ncbi:hypothetical protein ABTD29_19840, partial [Acinetobacter baumannii]
MDNSFLKLDGKLLELNEDYIPLAFSKGGSIKSVPSTAMNESGMPWFKDVKDVLEDNKTNPHFDIEAFIKREVANA